MNHSLSYRKVNVLSLQNGTMIKERYEVKKFMCIARLTELYEVIDKEKGDARCVMKFFNINNEAFQVEYDFLDKCRGVRGFPYLVEKIEPEIDGKKYKGIVTSYEGESWLSLLQRRKYKISIENTLRMGYKVFCLLETMHQKGYVHRDVQFSNILVEISYGGDVDVKLVDFEHTVVHTPAPDSLVMTGWNVSLDVIKGKPYTVFDDFASLVCNLMVSQGINPFGFSTESYLEFKEQFNNNPMSHFQRPETKWIGRLHEEIESQRTVGYNKAAIMEIFKNALEGVSPSSPISYTITNGVLFID